LPSEDEPRQRRFTWWMLADIFRHRNPIHTPTCIQSDPDQIAESLRSPLLRVLPPLDDPEP
jgi:hypothetical protein